MTLTAGTSTCPICGLTWLVTPAHDCMLPACGCFGQDTSEANPSRPCERCGINHALNCPKLGEDKPKGGAWWMYV